MDEKTIGTNAGKVWNVLNTNGSLTRYQLISQTGLQSGEVDAAIGWLAKEDKIRRDGEFYSLDITNLHDTIGTDAEVVFKVLKAIPYSALKINEITDMNEVEIHQAIGWLSKEGNVNLTSEPIAKEIIDETEQTMQLLKDEVDILTHDVEDRNNLINQLSKQLSDKQTESIHQIDVIEQMHYQINKDTEMLLGKHISVEEKRAEITQLKAEIETLHQDLTSRNQIISDLSKQLTDKHMQFIEQSQTIDKLHQQLSATPIHKMQPSSATTEIQQRIHHVSSIEQDITNPAPDTNLDFETRLYNNVSPALEIQEHQEIENTVVQPKSLDEIHRTIDDTLHEKIQKLRQR